MILKRYWTVKYIFFLTIFTLQIYTTYIILKNIRKIFSPKIYFFVSKSTLTHNLWPRHATDTWLRIKNYSVSWTFMSISKFYDIWPKLRHVGNMLMTFPTKVQVHDHVHIADHVPVNGHSLFHTPCHLFQSAHNH